MPIERLTPRFLEKIWGAAHLAPWFDSRQFAPPGAKIGEVWLESSSPLPVLVKFVFTSARLSVQVHPDDAYAARHHNSPGKTEMWHVLAAEPGAQIAAGFREPLSRERLREAALSGDIVDLLEWQDASPGNTFFLPAGTVHAIGAGLVLCEIQQPSDITYRLYDYGRPRELHLEHALAVSRREPCQVRRENSGTDLVSCDYFTTSRHQIAGHVRRLACEFVIAIHGQGEIDGRPIRAGEVWRSPDGRAEIAGDVTVLTVSTRPRR